MECPECGFENPAGTTACVKCTTPLPLDDVTLPIGAAVAPPTPSSSGISTGFVRPGQALEPGTVLGNRYEVTALLGEGGMGAVYKVRDREVDRFVALKIIRPELASQPEILQRFKHELILARKVTHKNVIRIFDLGEADGMKFITMDFIEGRDLKTLLREKGKFAPDDAVKIVSQVCRALDAAHSEGVIHRDLKPQNIMLDSQGRVTVMDFGIARSAEMPGMTHTGALVGTPEYMSPEQAKGEELDARSDLFTLGIIFYELLTGKTPYRAETAYGMIFKRTHERARPPIEIDPTIPPAINAVVVKCLEIDPNQRYSSAREILQDLGQQTMVATRPGVTVWLAPRWIQRGLQHRRWLAGGAGVLVLVTAFFLFRGKLPFGSSGKAGISGPAVTLAILPFRNASGDQTLDWLGPSLAEMLSTDVGQSSHLRTVSPDRLQQIMHDLQLSPDSTSSPTNVKRVADLSNADTVVWGQYAKFGDQIRVDATLRDVKRDRSVSFKTEASGEKDLLPAVDRLAQTIRDNLSLRRNVLDELKAQSFKPSSNSMDAIRLYSEGTDLARQGKNLEAVKRFQAATQADPDFALAYAKLGQTYANLGHDTEAEQASRKAVDLAENLPAREKYLITANYARIERDYPKAIEYYENLATSSPDEPDIQLALARLYEGTGALDKARDHYSKLLSGDPKNVDVLIAAGRVEISGGNPQTALDYFSRALAIATQLDNNEAKGTVLQGIGICYRQLNKQDEALKNFQQALEIRRRLGDKRGVAVTLNTMAQIQDQMGQSNQALSGYQEALRLRREIGDKGGIGDTLLDLGTFHNYRGHYDEALKYFKESLQVARDLGDESNQALCLNNIGTCYFSKGDYENAQTYFQQALDLREKSKNSQDIASSLHNLGQTSERMGQYDKALTDYERALNLYRSSGDSRGAATESYSMGTLFGYQGRYGAAVNAEQEALKSYTDLQDRTYWMTEVLSGYGMALADAGRFDEAKKALEDALALSRELKIDGSISQALDYQGECAFYRGDYKSARSLYEQALQFASRSKEQEKILLSKINIAKVDLKQGKTAEATGALRRLSAEADSLGLKYLSLESSIYLGQALIALKEYEGARQQLEHTSAEAEKLELRWVLTQANYSLASALRLTGHAGEATAHYRQALQYLNEIRKDTGSDAVMQRADIEAIYSEANRYLGSPKAN